MLSLRTAHAFRRRATPWLVVAMLTSVIVTSLQTRSFAEDPPAPQEGIVPGLTTKTTMVTHNEDGTWTAELSAGPVREPDPSSPSGWTPIDLTLGLAGARVARPWPTPT
jgi:hypothetical protein